jgi:hypothetical protein
MDIVKDFYGRVFILVKRVDMAFGIRPFNWGLEFD